MPDPVKHLDGPIAAQGLAGAAAAQPTTGNTRPIIRTPPPTGFQSPVVDGLDWSG